MPGHLISVNGSSKSLGLIRQAVAAGAMITLDSAAELELCEQAAAGLGVPARVRLRVRPDYDGLGSRSDFFPDVDVRLAAHRYKPGIPTEQAVAVGEAALRSGHLELTGLHAHLGRHSASCVWAGMAQSYAEVILRLSAAWGGWRPLEIDVGGGLPAPATRRRPTLGGAPPR